MVSVSSSAITLSAALLALLSLVQAAPTKTCTVQKSATDDALSIAQAFKDCQTGGTIVFPQGASFYPKSLILIQNLKNVNVQFNSNIVLPNYDNKFSNQEAYFEIRGDNIHFQGGGTFVGTGQQWWDAGNRQGPTVFRAAVVTNSVFSGFHITNAPRFHVTMTNCENVVLEKVNFNSVSKTKNFAYNTDAWGLANSNNVIFRDSVVTNGDDCTAINGAVSDITVSNITCNGGHGFSVIGALATDGTYQTFSNISIVNSVCNNCMNGVQLKASPGRPGLMSNIRFQNIQLNNVDNPILLTDHYFCDATHTSACYKNDGTGIKFKDVVIKNISGSISNNKLPIVQVNCAPNTPCENIQMSKIRIKANSLTTKNICLNWTGSSSSPYCK